MASYEATKVREAFQRAFGKAEIVSELPCCTVISVPNDEFTISVENNKLVWYDFTHTINLGPLNGSEINHRLKKFLKRDKKTKG